MPETETKKVDIPNFIQGPLTLEGKRQKAEEELELVADNFKTKVSRRNWSGTSDNLNLNEIRAQGAKLGPESIYMLEGFMGVENHIPEYAVAGFEGFKGSPARLDIHRQWVKDEEGHGKTLEMILDIAGARSQDQIKSYNEKVSSRPWNPLQHKGINNMIGSAIFAAEQERATYSNYKNFIRRVRVELGLREIVTEGERKRGQQFGMLEPTHRVAYEEITHHGVYIQIVKIYLNHFLDETLEKMKEVLESFKMPALRLIPNPRFFIEALLNTGVYSEAIHRRDAHIPTLKALGFESDEHLRHAVAEIEAKEGNHDRLESSTPAATS